MRKKLLFAVVIIALLALSFAISASASIIYKDTEGNTLFTAIDDDGNRIFESYEGNFPTTDNSGNALTWYVVSTEAVDGDTVHTVASFNTIDTTGEHASLSDAGQYKYVNQAKELSVVSVYFPDDSNILTLSMSDSGYGNSYGHNTDGSNLLFLRLPNTLTELPSRICQATNVIDCTVADNAPFETINNVAFYDCMNLRSVDISANITLIEGSGHSGSGFAFYNCISLVDVDFSENARLEIIDQNAFYNCKGLKEITIPNTVTSLGNNAFMYCSSLTTIRLGANTGRGLDTYNVQSMLYGCNSLKYVYMSNTMVPTSGSHLFDSGSSGMVIFYTGNEAEYEALKEILTTLKNNGKFVDATPIEWDATQDDQYYKDLAANENKNYVVYGYNTCKAFYDNEHDEQTPRNAFKGDKYVSDFCAFAECSRCPKTVETKLHGPLFISKGYSKSADAFMFDMKVDFDAIAAYEELGYTAPSYGFVVSANANINELIGLDGNVADTSVLKVNFDEGSYNNVQVRLNNITTDASKARKVHVCAYIIDTESVYYVGEGESAATSTMICHNDIPGEGA